MWMELNEMELNGREELLNPTASTETMPHYVLAASMAHMKVKWSDKGKGTKKWRKILVIAEGKMNLSWDAESK